MCDNIVTLDKNQVVIDTRNAFNDFDNSLPKNVINFILNVEVVTSENGPDNPMHIVPTHFEPKELGYNINVCKDVTEDVNENVNEDELISGYVNENKVISDEFADEIYAIRTFPIKGKKSTPNIVDHDVEELIRHILHDIHDNVKVNEHGVNGVINFIMSIEGKKLRKKMSFYSFSF